MSSLINIGLLKFSKKKSTDRLVGMKLKTPARLFVNFVLTSVGHHCLWPADRNSSADSSNSRLFKEMS